MKNGVKLTYENQGCYAMQDKDAVPVGPAGVLGDCNWECLKLKKSVFLLAGPQCYCSDPISDKTWSNQNGNIGAGNDTYIPGLLSSRYCNANCTEDAKQKCGGIHFNGKRKAYSAYAVVDWNKQVGGIKS